MKLTVWGSRGSVASAGPDTIRYGGNTVSVQVDGPDGSVLVLDAGTGIRRAGLALAGDGRPVHLLLTHLHMDHIQGLGFFLPLFEPGREVHIWGPPSCAHDLRERLTRYLSPPLFPVRIRDLASHVELHDVPSEPWAVDGFTITSAGIVHPGPTVGYRIEAGGARIAYMPDHEPFLGGPIATRDWLSGYVLARDADVLIHDGQYTDEEYRQRVGWGHSSIGHAVQLADLAMVRELVLIHHDPSHTDGQIDDLVSSAQGSRREGTVRAASEGMVLNVETLDPQPRTPGPSPSPALRSVALHRDVGRGMEGPGGNARTSVPGVDDPSLDIGEADGGLRARRGSRVWLATSSPLR